MANEFVQTMADARVDAKSLSEFIFKPTGFMVSRRLAPPINTLQYYIDTLENISIGGEFNSAKIASLTVSTGAAGTNASVVTGGTPSNRTFALTIPRGDTGANGANGKDGVDGSFTKKAYTTEALMIADKVNIPPNTSVDVTNDPTSSKNGMYAYNGTVFAKSSYDPLTQSKNYTDNKIETLKGTPIKYEAELNRINRAIVDTGVSATGLTLFNVDGAYVKIDVKDATSVTVSNSLGNYWQWVFVDDNNERIKTSEFFGDVSFALDSNVRYIMRTVKLGATKEPENLKVELTKITPTLTELETRIDDVESRTTSETRVTSSRELMMETAFAQGDMLKISDFTGSTQHAQIDNALAFIKRRGWGILDLESGTWMRNSAILLPDNCWLYLNNATVQLADGVFDNVIRNDGIVPNPDPFKIALKTNPNVNIRVFGNGIASSAVNASAVTHTAPHPVTGGTAIPFIGDFFGWRTISVYLVNVKGYKLHDFKINNSKCWAISQENGNEDFEVYNIDIQSYGTKNGDGVDVRFGCKNGSIHDITGSVGDDIVALTSIARTAPRAFPDGDSVYPMHAGGFIDSGSGIDITDIDIYNIVGRGQHNGVRLLAANDSKLQRISVSNVSDMGSGFSLSLVLVSSGYGTGAPMGAISDITVNGVASTNSGKALKIDGNIKDSIFNNITQANAAKVLVEDTATKENVTITNARRV